MQRKIFLIDIDGVICEHVPNEFPEKMAAAAPFPVSISKINAWFEEGHHICFFTARTDAHRQVTEEWMRAQGVKHHQILFNKPRRLHGEQYHYIDDVPVHATTFKGKFSDLVRKEKVIEVFDND